jgi:luciferase-like monooxygenase
VYDLSRSIRNRSSTEPSSSTPTKAQKARVDRSMNGNILQKRSGSRPRTTPTNPHAQLEQNPERQVVEELARRVFALPGVEERPSAISVPGARALWLRDDVPAGPPEAFMIGREFAHIHPMPDGSLHAALPPEVAQEAVEKGWAEQHPVARMGYIPQNVVMIYAPRNAEEIEVVAGLVVEAYRYAGGTAPGSG